MKKPISFFVLAATSLMLVAFAPKSTPLSGEIIDIDYTAQETKLSFPRPLWTVVSKYLSTRDKNTKEDAMLNLPMSLSLRADKKRVLFETGYRITLGEFGGRIDYSKFVNPKEKGKLFLMFNTNLDKEEIKNIKVYYMSSSRKRKIGEDSVGNKCNELLNLTDYFQKEVFANGMALPTAQSRHLSVTAGRFYFILPSAGFAKVSQITFSDSTQTGLVCDTNL